MGLAAAEPQLSQKLAAFFSQETLRKRKTRPKKHDRILEKKKTKGEKMAKTTGRVTMTEQYAKELLRRHPDWIIKDGQIGHPDDFEKKT